MINYLNIIMFKYPGIQGVSYWEAQYDGSPWNDPYEGLVWENTTFPKPTQSDLEQWQLEYTDAYQFMQNRLINKPIYDQLDQIDLKSIRALREGNIQRIADLESEAATLRAQLLPVS